MMLRALSIALGVYFRLTAPKMTAISGAALRQGCPPAMPGSDCKSNGNIPSHLMYTSLVSNDWTKGAVHFHIATILLWLYHVTARNHLRWFDGAPQPPHCAVTSYMCLHIMCKHMACDMPTAYVLRWLTAPWNTNHCWHRQPQPKGVH
jgi:hypothetical protein